MRAGLFLTSSLLSLTACSLLCETSGIRQPCDLAGDCQAGFSCHAGLCEPGAGGPGDAGDGGTPTTDGGDGGLKPGDAGLSCSASQTTCSDGGLFCADLDTDPANCAACSRACPPSNVCQGGSCSFKCTAPNVVCGGDGGLTTCVDQASDPDNCGGCGVQCGFQLGCAAGSCGACGATGQPCCRGGECGGLLGCQLGTCGPVQSSLAAGALHTCILSDGGAICFGADGYGQLGNGGTTNTSGPQKVVGLDAGLVAIAAGTFESCGIDTGGGLWCWGAEATDATAIPPTLSAPRLTAGPVTTPEPLQNISVGYTHDCAVGGSGKLYCWGAESQGELGIQLPDGGLVTAVTTPTAVALSGEFVAVSVAGQASTCLLGTGGQLSCFGDGSGGELGVASAASTITPQSILAVSQLGLSSGEPDELFCSIQTNGALACWGSETACSAADGGSTCYPTGLSTSYTPPSDIALPDFDTAVLVATAETHVCALGASGIVYCFGQNVYGELGDGTTNPSPTPVQALVPEAAIDLSVGFTHSCARGKSGAVYCWGSNSDGQLGQDPSAMPSSATPLALP